MTEGNGGNPISDPVQKAEIHIKGIVEEAFKTLDSRKAEIDKEIIEAEAKKKVCDEENKKAEERKNYIEKEIDKKAQQAVANVASKEKELKKSAKREKRWLLMLGIIPLFLVVSFPFALYWLLIRCATQFGTTWSRVVIFSVPQVILGVLIVVAIIAHARRDGE